MKRLRIDEKIDLLDSKVTLRVYADCRQLVLQTAKLQKGVIVVCDEIEFVEEGLGIGVRFAMLDLLLPYEHHIQSLRTVLDEGDSSLASL